MRDEPMTEQDWLTSEDFFDWDFHPRIVEDSRTNVRISILLAGHAIAHAIGRTPGVFASDQQRQQAEKAVADAFNFAEKGVDSLSLEKYVAEFQELTRIGLSYGESMGRMENWEIRLHGGSAPRGELLYSLWELSQVLQGKFGFRWKVLINTRQAVISHAPEDERRRVRKEERLWHTNLIRDIFANPFRAVAVDQIWLAWHDSTILKLAQAIYDEQNFKALPILADALEEAGCTNEDILDHCRNSVFHVRGCWLIDMILGRE